MCRQWLDKLLLTTSKVVVVVVAMVCKGCASLREWLVVCVTRGVDQGPPSEGGHKWR
jgi:hypothetical protein